MIDTRNSYYQLEIDKGSGCVPNCAIIEKTKKKTLFSDGKWKNDEKRGSGVSIS